MSNGANLPGEIIADVLSRLPVKSLCRFKSVSHSWHALISSDPNFAKTHLTRTNINNPHLLLLLLTSDSHSLYSVDCNDTVTSPTKLDFPPIEHDGHDPFLNIWGSCKGLVLAAASDKNEFLLNPSTRKSKKLPKSPFNFDLFEGFNQYGFGYDSSTDDFKVVMLSFSYSDDTTNIVSVYTLKTHSWRRIQDSPYVCNPNSGVYVNGCLHWLARRDSDKSTVVIAAFDLADEKFGEVPLPASVGGSGSRLFYRLAVLGGCLCWLAFEGCYRTDVWVMEEYGERESWTKFTIHEPNMSMEVFGFMGDGKVLLAIDGKKLVLYNPKDKTLGDMVVSGIPSRFEAAQTYVESLVSLDCDNGIGRQCEAYGERL